MELEVLVLTVASLGLGLVLRRRVSLLASRLFLATGILAVSLGLLVLTLTIAGWWPLGTWSAGLTSVILLAVAAFTLPFAIAVSVSR